MLKRIKYTLAIVSTCCALQGMAQLKVYPIPSGGGTSQKQDRKAARLQDQTPLTLPFWDDFSFTGDQPSDSLWVNSENVFINNGFADNPPSLGVATFDGITAAGTPYNANASAVGKTDSLTSQPIDLSALTVANNVYISFFYQYAGKGEVPDNGDSLRLEFKNDTGEWVSVWPGGGALDRTGNFVQVVKKIDDASFFYDAFQFRFQSFGRQSGPFDIWNVDYVYVNKNRSATDTSVPDRAINQPLSSFIKNYTAVPYKHLEVNDTIHPTFGVSNLNTNGAQEAQPIDYYINTETLFISLGDTVSIVNDSYSVDDPVESPIPMGLENAKAVKLPNIFSDITNQNADTTVINLQISVNTGDNEAPDYDPAKYAPIDFRINDTIRTTYILADYYAYDDGSAESGAGLNFSGDKLAYQYNLLTEDTAHIVAFDIYFPYIGSSPAGKSIDLMVWRDLDENSTSLLHQESATIGSSNINSFIRYELRKSVAVVDTFYIGYRQNTTGDLGVGLDKNTNSGSKIYYNLDGTWQQNETVEGSLMLRPVFGPPSTEGITPVDPTHDNPYTINVYPNPSSGVFRIRGSFDQVKVFDIRGAEKSFSLIYENDQAILNLGAQPEGLYILQFSNAHGLQTIKVIKKQ